MDAHRKEAVKLVRLVDRRGKPLDDGDRIERLRSQVEEAEIMLKLGLHPNIVAIRGILLLGNMQDSTGKADNLYMFMDYVEGDINLDTKIRLALGVALGLEHIRRCFPNSKFTHWDLKPSNIRVRELIPESQDRRLWRGFSLKHAETTHSFGSEIAAQTQHQWSWATTFLAMFIGGDYTEAVRELQLTTVGFCLRLEDLEQASKTLRVRMLVFAMALSIDRRTALSSLVLPRARAASVFDLEVSLRGKPVELRKFASTAHLVVNIKMDDPLAGPNFSKFRFLANKYYSNLRVWAFPTDQGYFEPDVAELIRYKAFSQFGFGQYPAAVVFDKLDVLGKTAHPLYRYLATYPDPNGTSRLTLNFEKFLLGSQGEILRRYPRKFVDLEDDIRGLIEGELPAESSDFKEAWLEAKNEAQKSEYAFRSNYNVYAQSTPSSDWEGLADLSFR